MVVSHAINYSHTDSEVSNRILGFSRQNEKYWSLRFLPRVIETADMRGPLRAGGLYRDRSSCYGVLVMHFLLIQTTADPYICKFVIVTLFCLYLWCCNHFGDRSSCYGVLVMHFLLIQTTADPYICKFVIVTLFCLYLWCCNHFGAD